MKNDLKATWDPKLDTFRVEFLVIPAALLGILVHYDVKAPLVFKEVPPLICSHHLTTTLLDSMGLFYIS